MKKCLILTSGGDAPGMNAAIRAVVRTAISNNIDVFGCEMGYVGLIEEAVFEMSHRSVANSIQRGGTILKAGRSEAFKKKDVRAKCIEFLHAKGIHSIVVLGGDGSFKGAKCLAQEGGLNVIGIPCTIDNDMAGTEYTIGFDTARNTALEAIDKIRDTAFSHDNDFMIEVMGRNAGFLAADVGIAGGAEMIITPEFPMTANDICTHLQKRKQNKMASIIVVAEGREPGWTVKLADEVHTKCNHHYRVCILGHTQRGGSPTAFDRKTATMMGYAAMQSLLQGDSQKMVAFNHGKIETVAFPSETTRQFNEKALLKINESLI